MYPAVLLMVAGEESQSGSVVFLGDVARRVFAMWQTKLNSP
jgi:hypothetical protein